MSTNDGEPRVPPRVRLVRPDLWTDEVVGRLAAPVVVAYLGLISRADDAGFLVWHPVALAVAVMPYASPGQRLRDMGRIVDGLCRVGLLRLYACGCAELPRVTRDHAMKGGNKTYVVRDWHLAHADTDTDEPRRTGTDASVSSSGSWSFSESGSGSRSGPDSRSGTEWGSGSRGAGAWNDGEWLERIHRLGQPLDKGCDGSWLSWRSRLAGRHDDATILAAVEAVIATGEDRTPLVQDLARSSLSSMAGVQR